jgi:hypothetical protein
VDLINLCVQTSLNHHEISKHGQTCLGMVRWGRGGVEKFSHQAVLDYSKGNLNL